MLLSSLIKEINFKAIHFLNKDLNVKYLTSNSKLIKKYSIYIADFTKEIKQEYINEAIRKGAIAIITNKKILNLKKTQFIVKNLNPTIDILLSRLKPFSPSNSIAVTGTNGKTSVVWMVKCMINAIGLDVKSLGTLGYYKNNKKIHDSPLTTPEKEELYQFAFTNKPNKINFIFEVSSHSISKKRISKIPINIAAITNITQDHLDYHKTYKNYKNIKFKLFLNFLSKDGIAIINDNIKNINSLKLKLKRKNINVITYGKNNSDVSYLKFRNKIKLIIFSKTYIVRFETFRDFELQNLSCSICCCLALGILPSKIIQSINSISKPKGRMELVNILNNGAKVFVDYAHTPDALKNILTTGECRFKLKKPNIVFGCGGDRDKGKRRKMAIIANKYANKIYITDDNPRNENPEHIRKDIYKNCNRALNISGRKNAIKIAIRNLSSNETLIIAGKGHEIKQIIKNKVSNFDDYKIANYYIKQINNQSK